MSARDYRFLRGAAFRLPVHPPGFLAGPHAQTISGMNVAQRNILFRAVFIDPSRRLRCQSKQLPNRRARSTPRTKLEPFAQQH
jgi:hypothetical protein